MRIAKRFCLAVVVMAVAVAGWVVITRKPGGLVDLYVYDLLAPIRAYRAQRQFGDLTPGVQRFLVAASRRDTVGVSQFSADRRVAERFLEIGAIDPMWLDSAARFLKLDAAAEQGDTVALWYQLRTSRCEVGPEHDFLSIALVRTNGRWLVSKGGPMPC